MVSALRHHLGETEPHARVGHGQADEEPRIFVPARQVPEVYSTAKWRHHLYVPVTDPLAGLRVGDFVVMTIPDAPQQWKDKTKKEGKK